MIIEQTTVLSPTASCLSSCSRKDLSATSSTMKLIRFIRSLLMSTVAPTEWWSTVASTIQCGKRGLVVLPHHPMTELAMRAPSLALATRGAIAAPNGSGKVLVRRRHHRGRERPLRRNPIPLTMRAELKLGPVDPAHPVVPTASCVSTEWPWVNDTIVMLSSLTSSYFTVY